MVEDAKAAWPENFDAIEEGFNRCCFAMAYNVIGELGLFQEKGDFETLGTIRDKVGLFKDAEYVMGQILRILCDEGVLEEKDGGYLCVDNDPYIEKPAEALVIATRQFPEEGAPYQWLARSQDGLVGFIKGKLFAQEVMFPMGDFKLVEEVYNTSSVYSFYSRLGGRAVRRLVEGHFNRPVTLFEIGAGTGNGTANVLSQTSDRFERYIFTDVAKALIQRGQRRFKKSGYDFLEYREFDAMKDLGEQDVSEGIADIALAVNVMHATDDILTGLNNAKRVLKDGGILLLSEIAPPKNGIYRYMELTFGLLPSYAVYTDRARRPISPIIRPQEWVSAFEAVGFKEVLIVPGDGAPDLDRGGVVIGVK
ncbi:MAG: class I SAM-dependent methyltransferase [Candidatus Lokiarchaeota archaeon]|nr:class I SAM-dependent methyltransferase [Candidatus Lokiarchaeota archaeon]